MAAPGSALDTSLSGDALAIAAHDAAIKRVEAVAETFAAAGSFEDAAACAQIGALIGWLNHPGRFASARLERVLRAGAATLPAGSWAGPSAKEPKRVLHVLSEGYETGGHTRPAWRWMLQDPARRHALALTRHRPVPPDLLPAGGQRGGGPADMPRAGG